MIVATHNKENIIEKWPCSYKSLAKGISIGGKK